MDDQDALTSPPPDDAAARKPGSNEDEKDRLLRRIAEEIASKLPANLRDDEGAAVAIEELISFEFSQGPYPPPSVVAEYERISPGLGQKIIDRSDREQAFRHEMIRESASQDRLEKIVAGWSRLLAQTAVLLIALAAIGGGVYCGQGLAAIIGTVSTLAGVFLVNKYVESRTAKKSGAPDDSEGET